jgi:hypothetical protein
MPELTDKELARRPARNSSIGWIAALVALLMLGFAWIVQSERRPDAVRQRLSLPVTEELPAMPDPQPMPVSPRPLG